MATLTYSCEMYISTQPELCAFGTSTDANYAIFDASQGYYELKLTDTIAYPPGSYTLRISASAGDVTVTTSLILSLTCSVTHDQFISQLIIAQTLNRVYVYRDYRSSWVPEETVIDPFLVNPFYNENSSCPISLPLYYWSYEGAGTSP